MNQQLIYVVSRRKNGDSATLESGEPSVCLAIDRPGGEPRADPDILRGTLMYSNGYTSSGTNNGDWMRRKAPEMARTQRSNTDVTRVA